MSRLTYMENHLLLKATSIYCRILTLLVLICTTYGLKAQTPVQVVTKVIEKEIACPEGLDQRIRINARKADVVVKGWPKPVVSIRLRLIAKHPERAIAERELAYQQYNLQLNGSLVELANQFVIPQRAGKLQSQLKAVYEVSVPNRALLTISNSFGDVAVRGLSGETAIQFEFGKLTLDDMGGKVSVSSDYGDVEGHNINATLSCKAEKANINLRDLGGTNQIQSRYGRLMLVPSGALNGLQVDADRTDVLFMPRKVDDFQYDWKIANNSIHTPPAYANRLERSGNGQRFRYQPTARGAIIRISNKYNPVHLMPLGGVEAPVGSK